MEDRAPIVQWLLRVLADAGLARAEREKVFARLWGQLVEQLEHDSAHPDVTDGDVEEAARFATLGGHLDAVSEVVDVGTRRLQQESRFVDGGCCRQRNLSETGVS